MSQTAGVRPGYFNRLPDRMVREGFSIQHQLSAIACEALDRIQRLSTVLHFVGYVK